MRRVCVFCGSSDGADPAYREAGRQLGKLLAEEGLGLVYGGGSIGVMGAMADAALVGKGEVIGVIPEVLQIKERGHKGLTDLRVVGSMHERKALMAELADGFVALPGGMGTLDEFCEIVTWAQLGLHAKPCGLLDVKGYFGPFVDFIDRAVAQGFVRVEHRALIHVDSDAQRLLDRMRRQQVQPSQRWIGKEQT
ncbi:MAG: TIGR00730 family Rossman fold protein [Deltaproteobacteria bacterium]|nr:TIGR00730 family Rossman fold protein [Deltaproteobacteria bacterium]